MKNNLPLDLYVAIDRSSSMGHLKTTVIEEINRLVATIEADDPDATVTLVTFDSEEPFDVVLDRLPVRRFGRVGPENYVPGRGTPLLDALGATIGRATRHAHDDVRAGNRRRTVVAVITDGEENASVQYSYLDIVGKLGRRRAAGWQLIYLGPGDALADAARLGFRPEETHPWDATEAGTRAAFATIAGLTTGFHVRRPIRRRHH